MAIWANNSQLVSISLGYQSTTINWYQTPSKLKSVGGPVTVSITQLYKHTTTNWYTNPIKIKINGISKILTISQLYKQTTTAWYLIPNKSKPSSRAITKQDIVIVPPYYWS